MSYNISFFCTLCCQCCCSCCLFPYLIAASLKLFLSQLWSLLSVPLILLSSLLQGGEGRQKGARKEECGLDSLSRNTKLGSTIPKPWHQFIPKKLNLLGRSLHLSFFYGKTSLQEDFNCLLSQNLPLLCCHTPSYQHCTETAISLTLFQCSLNQSMANSGALFPALGQSVPGVLDAPPGESKLHSGHNSPLLISILHWTFTLAM